MSGQVIVVPVEMAFTQEPKPDGSSGTWVMAAENEYGSLGNKARSMCRVADGQAGDGSRRESLNFCAKVTQGFKIEHFTI